MMKKAFSLICALMMTFSAFSAMAADNANKEILINGDFEVLNKNGTVYGWQYNGDSAGIITDDTVVHGGKYAIREKSSNSPMYLSQNLSHLVDSCTYELTAWMYMVDAASSSPRIKFEFKKDDKAGKLVPNGELDLTFRDIVKDQWKEHKFSVTLPKDTVGATILVRLTGSNASEFLWDDISLKGQRQASYVETPLPENYPLQKLDPDKLIPYDEKTATEFFQNKGFELVSTANKPVSWSVKETGGTVSSTTENPKEGRFAVALNVTTAATGTFVYQSVKGLLSGADYKLSGWLKMSDAAASASVFIEWHEKSGAMLIGREITFKVKEANKWEEIGSLIQAPINATSAVIMFRTKSSTAKVFWDDVSFKGKMDDGMYQKDSVLRDGVPGSPEFVKNGGLEESADGAPASWKPYGNKWDTAWTTEKVYSGSRALKLSSESSSNSPYIEQFIEIVPGATYQLSMRINLAENYANYGIMPEMTYYSSTEPTDENKIALITAPSFIKSVTYDRWVLRGWEFNPPAGTKLVKLYVRLFRQGTAYIDDISLKMVDKNGLSTEEIFYYSDLEYGIATATASRAAYGDINGYTVDFRLKDGSKVLDEKTGADLSGGETKYFFKIAQLVELYKEYTLEATYKDATGNVINVKTTPVYKYDRPSVLTKSGIFMENGKPLNPVLGYHVQPEQYSKMVELGVNVVQTYTSWATPDGIVARLDEIQKYGLKALVTLYPGGTPAGSEKNAENTKAVVSLIKNHPAVFAYAIEDEPLAGSHYTVDSAADLLNSYKTIREIDPKRPVYIVDAKMYDFPFITKRVDFHGVDPYPGAGDATKFVYDSISNAVAETYNGKPVLAILQACTYIGYWPTADVLRNMIYQGFFAGAKTTGYYAFDEKSPAGVPMEDSELGQAIKSWYDNESEMMFDYFVNEKYQSFAGFMDKENYCYRSFVKDGDIYMIVLNRKQKEETAVNIPLISDNLRVKVGGYTASVYAGGVANTVSGTETLSLTLSPGQAVVYKITPAEPVNTESLKLTSFTDIEAYSWAKDQIAQLESRGVVNAPEKGQFKPGENITRGDFAMFLIRALGLRSSIVGKITDVDEGYANENELRDKDAENFTDVDTNAYYAKELAIGKALGILKGVGDGSYGPETYISRQDMMVICARGMRVASKLGKSAGTDALAQFTDAASIAGYATGDVAAMVLEGIVKGNADGTMNPLGNTTRAEAAVIMHRIMN